MRTFTVKPKTITAATKIDTNKLEQELWAQLEKSLRRRGFPKGDDSWKDYTVVEIRPDESDPNRIIAEVRSEYLVDFDSQMDISTDLDKVIEKYDRDAYFEAEDAGISRAYLSK